MFFMVNRPTTRPSRTTELDMPEERCEVRDPALEGHAEVIGFDESVQIGYRRASFVRFIIARARRSPRPR